MDSPDSTAIFEEQCKIKRELELLPEVAFRLEAEIYMESLEKIAGVGLK